MSFESSSIQHKAAIGVSGLATLLQLIAIGTPGWFRIVSIEHLVDLTYGLWNICLNGKCADWSPAPGKFQTTLHLDASQKCGHFHTIEEYPFGEEEGGGRGPMNVF